MNAIYSVKAASDSAQGALTQVWAQADSGLANGYTSVYSASVGGRAVLFAFASATQQLDAYILTGADPFIEKSTSSVKLPPPMANATWDKLRGFVLGNITYLLTYSSKGGQFGFFAVSNDLQISPPTIFTSSHSTPSTGFTEVAPYTSLGTQYIAGYDYSTGRVENFSVSVVPTSTSGTPPLLALNIWYHLWAKGWTNFSFFQLGGANFFFKINKLKLNVNIDHMQDNPALGSVEVGSWLQDQMPDAISITAAGIIPWANSEPYLLTYIASSGVTAFYKIHSDCLGWTPQASTITVKGATLVVNYRIGDTSYVLLYQGPSTENPQ